MDDVAQCETCRQKVCNCPLEIRGKFRNHNLINAKCDDYVRHGIANGWDRESLVEWVRVSWLNQTTDKENGDGSGGA